MIHTIQSVREAEYKLHRMEITWQTQAICSFLANTIEDDKARKQMVDVASKLTLLGDDEIDLSSSEVDTSSERSLEDIIENGSVEAALKKNNGRRGPGIAAEMRFMG